MGSPKGSYLVSADIRPHFFIGSERFRWAFAFTPRYKVRIFQDNAAQGDSSLPVRTPSFMPGGILYIPLNLGDPNVYKDIQFLSVAFFHHSNGQDHRTFLSNGQFNLYNGNFSTNFFEVGYTKNWRTPSSQNVTFECRNSSDPCKTNYPTGYKDYVWKIALEQHFGTAFEQRGTYGRTRLNSNFQFIRVNNFRWLSKTSNPNRDDCQLCSCYLKERFRIVGDIAVNLDKLEKPFNSLDRRINFEASFLYRVAAGNTALFASTGFYGNDPYNIYYSHKYAFFRVGLALGMYVHTLKMY